MNSWNAGPDELDYDREDGPRTNWTCSDCHRAFYKGRQDDGDLCDSCCSLRDAIQKERRMHTEFGYHIADVRR